MSLTMLIATMQGHNVYGEFILCGEIGRKLLLVNNTINKVALKQFKRGGSETCAVMYCVSHQFLEPFMSNMC